MENKLGVEKLFPIRVDWCVRIMRLGKWSGVSMEPFTLHIYSNVHMETSGCLRVPFNKGTVEQTSLLYLLKYDVIQF